MRFPYITLINRIGNFEKWVCAQDHWFIIDISKKEKVPDDCRWCKKLFLEHRDDWDWERKQWKRDLE